MDKTRRYIGIDRDASGGMTSIGNIIHDAWVFGLLPEEETCAGWTYEEINSLYDRVTKAWKPYGHLASNLPEELRRRHARIYAAAIEYARAHGWDPELGEDE